MHLSYLYYKEYVTISTCNCCEHMLHALSDAVISRPHQLVAECYRW